MRPILFLPLLAIMIVFSNCNSKSSSTQTTDQNSIKPLNRDSLRHLYEAIIKTRTNLLPAAQVVEAGKIYPVDEGQSDTTFFVFREAMLKAIGQRNEFKLLELVDDQVRTSFAGKVGMPAFVEGWKLDTQKDSSKLWQVLTDVLQMGGTFGSDKQTFTAPYYIATFPDAYDVNVFGVITGAGVRVRAMPNLNSQILKTISYDVLPVLDWSGKPETVGGETYPWVKIKLGDKKEGYVYGKFIGSPLDYRATFKRQPNGAWLMISLIKGN